MDYIQKPINEIFLNRAIRSALGLNIADQPQKRVSNVYVNPLSVSLHADSANQSLIGIFIIDFPNKIKCNYNNSLELFQYFLLNKLDKKIPNIIPYNGMKKQYSFGFFYKVTLSEISLEQLYKYLQDIQCSLRIKNDIYSYIILSSEISDVDTGNRKYVEMNEYLSYINLLDEDKVFFLEKINHGQGISFDIHDYAMKIVGSVLKNNKDGIKTIIDELFNELSIREYVSIFVIRLIASKLVLKVGNQLERFKVNVSDVLASKLESLYSTSELCTIEYVSKWLEKFMIQIVKLICEQKMEGRLPKVLEEMVAYININYAKSITLKSLADHFYFHPSYVSRLFVKHLKLNYVDYINEVRLERAKELLIDQDNKIMNVAKMIGFENSGYFSRQFKKKYGESPQNYRDRKKIIKI